MNDFFLFSNIAYEGLEKFGNLYYSGNCHIIGTHCFYFENYLYAKTEQPEVYFQRYITNVEEFLKGLNGEFLLADYDKKSNQLVIITDHFAKVPAYIYENLSVLTISSDYWNIIKLLKPTIEDINWIAVKTMIIHSFILDCDTLVKNVKRIPTATIYRNNIKQLNPIINRYWRLSFKEDYNLTLQAATERMEEIFNNTFRTLKEKFPTDTKFGIGVSGGWDSRLLLDYANKYNMRIVPYCVGQKYSRFPLRTNGYNIIKKILKLYNIKKFTFVEHDSEDYYTKLSDDVSLAPLKSADFMIGCKSQIPDFDVMLNGEHGGVFLGEFNYKKILGYGIDSIYKYILSFLSYQENIEMIQNLDEQTKIAELLKKHIDEMHSVNKYEIFFRCFFELYGSMSKTGFFETIYLSHERYTPYLDAAFIEFFQTWNMQFLVNRTLQRDFFMEYHEKLSKMPDETSDAPLYWRDYDVHYCLKRYLYAVKNKLFKTSLRRQAWLEEDNEYINIARNVIINNKNILNEFFPDMDSEVFRRSNPRSYANLIKMLIEIDCIVDGGTENIKNFMKKISE